MASAPGIISGTVTNEDGQTISNATVEAIDQNDADRLYRTTTDANGYFEISVAGGAYHVSARWQDSDNNVFTSQSAAFINVESAIPGSVVNRAPLDEGSGASFADVVGNAPGSLDNGGTWESNSAFSGGTAPTFDQSNGEGGSWQPRSTPPVTYTMRVRADAAGLQQSDGSNHVFSFGGVPRLGYETNSDEWFVSDGADNTAHLAESQSSLEGSIRVVAFRLDSDSCDMDIYEADAQTKVGSASISTPNTSFDTSTMDLMRYPGAGSVNSSFGDVLDLIDAHDVALSDSELDSVVADVYG